MPETPAPGLEAFRASAEAAMAAADMDWYDLGRELGVTHQAVRNYFSGETYLRPDRCFRIEQILGVQPGSLSRHLGYLPLDAVASRTVPAAARADRRLDDDAVDVVITVYETAVAQTRARRLPRPKRGAS